MNDGTLRGKSSGVGRKRAGSSRETFGLVIILLFALALCPGFASWAFAQTPSKKGPMTLERKVFELERDVARLKSQVDMYSTDHLPETVVLCDRKILVSRDDIRERLEREYFQLLENRGLVTILIKRYLKYQAAINEEIQNMSVPSDLVYLVLAESYLNPRALSSASAAGLWQFIKETGKREGLYVGDHVDERYNVKKATKSALSHLKKLYGEFGDWFIAMAAYNAGAARLREAIENQETTNFFDLFLPEETERYILRIISIKEIVSNREKYGFFIDEKALYKPYAVAEVTLDIGKEAHTNILSKSMDLPYKAFRDINLHIRKYKLSKGVYHIYVPNEKKGIFLQKLKAFSYITVVTED
jgi:membrane-bound lytic murein transglycosylase D